MDIQAALRDGYTKDEVMAELGRRTGMNYQSAIQDGYSPDEILTEMSNRVAKPKAATPAPEPEKGFFGGVNEAIVKRGVNIADELSTPTAEGLGTTLLKAPERALRVVGQGAGLVGDIGGQAVKSLYKTITPESTQASIKEGIKSVLDTDAGKMGVEAAKSGYEAYQGFKKEYPNVAKDLEATVNIASLLPITKVGQGVLTAGKETVNIGRDVVTIAKSATPAALDKQLTAVISRGIEKAIRPTVVGKRTAPQVRAYYERAKTAVKSIIDNKDNLILTDAEGGIVKGLPKTVKQFSEAIDQTKRSVFQQYDEMATSAGRAGVDVDLAPAVKELESLAGNKVLNDMSPEIAEYALKRAEALSSRGVYTATEAQDAIAHLNKSLESFYKNPSYETANRAGVDALIVNNLRKSLDDAIEGVAGSGYQDLKRTYGALKTLEKEVSHRAVVDARKNVKGLLDFTDVLTSGELLGGLLTMNPTMAATGFFGRMVKGFYKRLNDPNRTVKGMFSDAEALLNRSTVQPNMRSAAGRAAAAFLAPADESITMGSARLGPLPAGASAERGIGPVRSGVTQGEAYGPQPATLRNPKQLPPGQGFEMVDSDIIDIPFTSTSRPTLRLPEGQQPPVQALPAGQGFELRDAAGKIMLDDAGKKSNIQTPGDKNEWIKAQISNLEKSSGKVARGEISQAKRDITDSIIDTLKREGFNIDNPEAVLKELDAFFNFVKNPTAKQRAKIKETVMGRLRLEAQGGMLMKSGK